MDRNFHTDDFERMLREKSDEFRMYPSKRIWHSVYNNIHPRHKWPSVAMCITLISALLLVGYLNTRNANSFSAISRTTPNNQTVVANQTKQTQSTPTTIANLSYTTAPLEENTSNNNTGFKDNQSTKNTTPVKSSLFTQPTPAGHQSINLVKQSPLLLISVSNHGDLPTNNQREKKANIELIVNTTPSNNEVDIYVKAQKDLNEIAITDLEDANIEQENVKAGTEFTEVKSIDHAIVIDVNTSLTHGVEKVENISKAGIQVEDILSQVEKLKITPNKNNILNLDDKNWIENYALYNRPAPKKWANKLDWQVYATPSVVYRTLNNIDAFGNTLNATPFAISPSSQNINSSVMQTPSIGFELGTGLKYLIAKNIKIKGAFQLNFTRYNAHAFQNSHPVATKLTMHNFETKTSYEVYRSTAYSNNSGLESVKLHNETFQLSIPVGIDLKLIGNDRLQWNVGATIQPTFVAGGKSYLISSDRHNYVTETSMLNRLNLNAGFETFISFKSNGLTWQIGPQFRKQLFSTNSKTFAVEEKLVNYGIKFGVSRTLK